MCDLLWADPAEEGESDGWAMNERGVSYTFGKGVTEAFLEKHDLSLICRAHQVVEDGYQFHFDKSVVTIFSAPNYCGEFDNVGGMLSVGEDLVCTFQLLEK